MAFRQRRGIRSLRAIGWGGAVMILCGCAPERPAFDGRDLSSAPFKVARQLEIASRHMGPSELGALHLVCDTKGQLHMVERIQLPPLPDRKVPWTYDATLIVERDFHRELVFSATLVALGATDTVATPALSRAQYTGLADTFGAAPPREVYLGGAEDSVTMRGASTGPIIRTFGDRCAAAATCPLSTHCGSCKD
jgi:hypothetical protein